MFAVKMDNDSDLSVDKSRSLTLTPDDVLLPVTPTEEQMSEYHDKG
jgi:hypothetical protein